MTTLDPDLAERLTALGGPDAMDDLDALVDEDDTLEYLLHGGCHLMAIALHEASGLPIGAVFDHDERGKACLLHVFVVHPDGIVDVKGLRSASSMLDDFQDTMDFGIDEDSVVETTSEIVMRMGSGRRPSRECRERLAVAREIAPLILSAALPPASPVPEGPPQP